MIRIPPGEFRMGRPMISERPGTIDSHTDLPFGPEHLVTFAHEFAFGEYDVTRAQFSAFVAETDYRPDSDCVDYVGGSEFSNTRSGSNWRNPRFQQTANEPVVCVNQTDAEAYIKWLSKKARHNYRLPSEAEWEYVAQQGSSTDHYWAASSTEACRHANVRDRTFLHAKRLAGAPGDQFDCSDGYAFTSSVGHFPPNALHLADMLGNVRQLTSDCWHFSYLGAPSDGSAWRVPTCMSFITRGAAFDDPPRLVNVYSRTSLPEFIRANNVGFRVVRSLE
jgi:sulfatase modifying factor 1